MNKICKKCDTRCRLKLCDGKEGDFKYCYRKTGSLDGLEESIRPFNDIKELYYLCEWKFKKGSLEMKPYSDQMNILLGIFEESDKLIPVGFVSFENSKEDE